MHKFYAVNWGLEKHLLLHEIHPLDRVPGSIGMFFWNVLEVNKLLKTVQVLDGIMVIIIVVV